MKLYDMGISFLVVVAGIALVAGYTGMLLSGKPDSAVEETAEEVLEFAAEQALDLEPGSLNIDITPNSPENEKD